MDGSNNGLREAVNIENKMPLVSVLVFCYKNENLLYGMLDSILIQDYANIQLIISDDASYDFDKGRVLSYLRSHKHANIKNISVLQNKINLGTVKHVKKVLEFAQGEFVLLSAADDRFVGSDAISGYVDQFAGNKKAEWLVAKCSVVTPDYKRTIYNTPTEKDLPYFIQDNPIILFSRWARRGMAVPCSFAFRKTAFNLVGGIDLDYKYLEDWPLVLKLLRNGNMPIYYDKITALHSAGGVTNSNERYGVEIRKSFYEDKYHLFSKEVMPFYNLLQAEDKKALKVYLKEIMERAYFFDIDLCGKSRKEIFVLCLKKPYRFLWLLEQHYNERRIVLEKKKMLAFSQVLLLIGAMLISYSYNMVFPYPFLIMGILDSVAAFAIMFACLLLGGIPVYAKYKANIRRNLVN